MRLLGLAAATAMLLAGCEGGDEGPELLPAERSSPSGIEAPSSVPPPSPTEARNVPAARWDLQASGEGVALALMPKLGRAVIRLFCPAGDNSLLANVPAFRPIASEERLSLGSGGYAVALVADTGGDRQRGGVSGAGAVRDDLAVLIGGAVSASYGAQRSGPHPEPPRALSAAFVAACRDDAIPARPSAAAQGNPCLVQDGEPLRTASLRAIGTEHFWGARVEGRCVTYSHTEDQKGTRVWTRFTLARGGGIWIGALGGRPFELRTRPRTGCSDGMSDERYPFAVDLLVGGERRTGCAEPL